MGIISWSRDEECLVNSSPTKVARIPIVINGLSLLLILALLQRFFSAMSCFPPSTKNQHFSIPIILIWKQWMKSLSMGCVTTNSYFILFIILFIIISWYE